MERAPCWLHTTISCSEAKISNTFPASQQRPIPIPASSSPDDMRTVALPFSDDMRIIVLPNFQMIAESCLFLLISLLACIFLFTGGQTL